MYQIVAGIDESEARAIAQAEDITEMPLDVEQVHVTLVHSFVDNPEGASVEQVGSVREAADILEEHGFEVTLEETSGDPADAILDMAEDRDADMIVVAGRKRTPAGKVLFGSVTQSIILGTDLPVFVSSAGDREE